MNTNTNYATEYKQNIKPETTVVLYHDDADGFGAAYACYYAGGLTDATYIAVNYGQPVPALPEKTTHMIIVDFSYPRVVCDELASKYNLLVIDHHKTAQAELDEAEYAIFDMSKSGCALAWEYLTKDAIPKILRYVQDRDLWLWDLDKSKEINAYISTLDFDFQEWKNFNISTAINSGRAILKFQEQQMQQALKRVKIAAIGNYEVPVVNATDNISELGNLLCKQYADKPFSASYCDRGDVRAYSLRSIGDFDVSVVAKKYGGGGHKNAAGFSVPLV